MARVLFVRPDKVTLLAHNNPLLSNCSAVYLSSDQTAIMPRKIAGYYFTFSASLIAQTTAPNSSLLKLAAKRVHIPFFWLNPYARMAYFGLPFFGLPYFPGNKGRSCESPILGAAIIRDYQVHGANAAVAHAKGRLAYTAQGDLCDSDALLSRFLAPFNVSLWCAGQRSRSS